MREVVLRLSQPCARSHLAQELDSWIAQSRHGHMMSALWNRGRAQRRRVSAQDVLEEGTLHTSTAGPWMKMRIRLPRRILRASTFNLLFCLFVIWNAIDVAWVYSIYAQQAHLKPNVGARNESIFIASIHWNNEAILRQHWVPAVAELAKHLGPDHVFISVQESGSWDDSKGALRVLDSMLEKAGIDRRIILDETTHLQEISKPPGTDGWVRTSRDRIELRRVPYLAGVRNSVLGPLYELAERGIYFDRVLFINDVVFTVSSILPS